MVPISSNIYSGEAVIFDNRSLFDYAQKIEDRKAKRALAEQEAADNAIKDLTKNLTPTGMRVGDIPDFLKMQEDFRGLEGQYRGTRNPLRLFELQKKADEMFLFINQSKQAAKDDELATGIASDPNKLNKVDFVRLAGDLDKHRLPLRDPNRVQIGALSNYFFPEQYDEVSTFNEASKGVDKSQFPSTTVGKDKVIPIAYGDDAIRLIADNYLKLVSINRTGLAYYTGKIKNLSADKIAEALVKVKKYFPKLDIEDDDPSLLMLSDAIEKAERVRSTDIQNATKVSISNRIGDKDEKKPVDYYAEIYEKASKARPGFGYPLNDLDASTQTQIIDFAEKITKKEIDQGDIYVKKIGRKIYIMDAENDKIIAPLTRKDVNIPRQVGVEEKRAASKDSSNSAAAKAGSKKQKKYNPNTGKYE